MVEVADALPEEAEVVVAVAEVVEEVVEILNPTILKPLKSAEEEDLQNLLKVETETPQIAVKAEGEKEY